MPPKNSKTNKSETKENQREDLDVVLDINDKILEAVEEGKHYHLFGLDFVIERYANNSCVVSLGGNNRNEKLDTALENFLEDEYAKSLLIPIHHDDHFTGLYITRNVQQEIVVNYFDPLGNDLGSVPQEVSDISERVGIDEENIVRTSNIIQSYSSEKSKKGNKVIKVDNVHCGAFVGFILAGFAENFIQIRKDVLQINIDGSWFDIAGLDEGQSNLLGQSIRKRDAQIIKGEVVTEDPRDILRAIILVKFSDVIEEKFQQKTFTTGSANSKGNKGKIKLDTRKIHAVQNNSLKEYAKGDEDDLEELFEKDHKRILGSLRDTAVQYPVIKQKSPNKFTVVKSIRNSGYDEMFDTAKYKKWDELDNKLGLEQSDDDTVTFKEAHAHARTRTHELHGADSGHVGSMYKTKTGAHNDSQKTAGYFKQSYDKDKEKIIDGVVKLSKTSRQKKVAAIKATSEILKLQVGNTLSYADYNDVSSDEFEGFTNSGLDLSDNIERKFAAKSSQMVRDKKKMAIIALENRWNDSDSDEEKYTDDDLESVIKRKVTRTIVSKEISGAKKDRNLSPIRDVSPCSHFSFQRTVKKLNKAAKKENQKAKYTAVIDVVAMTTPPLIPTPEFKEVLKKEAKKDERRTKKAQTDPRSLKDFVRSRIPSSAPAKTNSNRSNDEETEVTKLRQLGQEFNEVAENKKESSSNSRPSPSPSLLLRSQKSERLKDARNRKISASESSDSRSSDSRGR